MSNFECYSEATNPIQHLRQYQDKIVVHSHDDLLLSRVFPSSLKGCRLKLVLFAPETISLKFLGGEVCFVPPIRFPTGAEEK